ncbi:MAG: adenine phosphoribosyltransferase [Elusimicrobiota bacterium]
MLTEKLDLKSFVRDVPDFPKKGIVFKDITPLLGDAKAFPEALERLAEPFRNSKIAKVVAIESRGFIFGGALSRSLEAGFVPVRKKGKLPYKTTSAAYQLEYGTDTLEMHVDALKPGEKVLIVDDVLATGGTARAVMDLVRQSGAETAGLVFLIELSFLKGREKLDGSPVAALIQY